MRSMGGGVQVFAGSRVTLHPVHTVPAGVVLLLPGHLQVSAYPSPVLMPESEALQWVTGPPQQAGSPEGPGEKVRASPPHRLGRSGL